MANPSLVNEVKALSLELRKALSLSPGPDIYNDVTRGGVKRPDDFLFEVKAYFSLVLWLKNNGWAISVENQIGNKVKLAFSPGAKEHFTYFKIQSSSWGTWHLVHGTEIASMIPGVPISPDISLQHPSAKNHPSAGQIWAIWDAKFHGSNVHSKQSQKRLTRREYQSVVWNRDKLNVPKPPHDCPLEHFPPAFEVSGIITNVQGLQSSKEMSKADKISIVVNFQDATSPTSLARKEHQHISLRYARVVIQTSQKRTIKLSKRHLKRIASIVKFAQTASSTHRIRYK